MRRASIHAEIAAIERKGSITSIDRNGNFDQEKSEKLDDLTPETALDLVKPFFPEEWAKLSAKDISLRKIT